MKLLLSIATYVHGTDDMHNHLRGPSFKKTTKQKNLPQKKKTNNPKQQQQTQTKKTLQ